MTCPAFWSEVWTAELVNHLWQSTVVTLIAWILALTLRSNPARTRYWVWMIASLKFLVPFSLLIAGGEWLRSTFGTHIRRQALAAALEKITQPFPLAVSSSAIPSADVTASVASYHVNLLPLILPPLLIAVWLCGLIVVAFSWIRGWLQMRAAIRASSRMALLAEVPVFSSPQRIDPCVFGIVRPVLLLPEGIGDRLAPEQLCSIIAHEMCHVRRHDNLTAAIHMTAEALFWFHPAVWWIKSRLLEERERACDEAVLQLGIQADIYAESILNVCKFYVESPLICVSGVTGSDLKRRIVRIMQEQIGKKLDLSRKLLLTVAATVALAAPIVLGLVHINQVNARTISSNLFGDIAGTWQGTLHFPKTDLESQGDLRLVAKIYRTDAGALKAVWYSIDQNSQIPVSTVKFQEGVVKFKITGFDRSYEGKMSGDGRSIAGNWMEGTMPISLHLVRTTPDMAWAIPELPKQMAADADPSFEVATIKPSKPGTGGGGMSFSRNHFRTIHTNLNDLIAVAYGLHVKQILGEPEWFGNDLFDIDGVPNAAGSPNATQLKGMIQKLLADRFQLKFHRGRRELPVYIVTVAPGGAKMEKSDTPPGQGQGFFFTGFGDLIVANNSMADFSHGMQGSVMDEPVVDRTGLTDRYNFRLKWTPDQSRPSLYKAVQTQLGLKIEASKAMDDVIVVDHAQMPSAN